MSADDDRAERREPSLVLPTIALLCVGSLAIAWWRLTPPFAPISWRPLEALIQLGWWTAGLEAAYFVHLYRVARLRREQAMRARIRRRDADAALQAGELPGAAHHTAPQAALRNGSPTVRRLAADRFVSGAPPRRTVQCTTCGRLSDSAAGHCRRCGTATVLGIPRMDGGSATPADQQLFELTRRPVVRIDELAAVCDDIPETTFVAVGGGMGSFAWVDALRLRGVGPQAITVLGTDPAPYARFQALCEASQIGHEDRLRSNSEACPDNPWGFPGYALREAARALRHADLLTAASVTGQLLGEPVLATTYVPRAGDVYAAMDREARRIGWSSMWQPGRVRAIRKTDDGRFLVVFDRMAQPGAVGAVLARFVHLSVGYPGIRLLPALRAWREGTGDVARVVQAYEPHTQVYRALAAAGGGTVVLEGRGIVASRVLQRLGELRRSGADVRVLHLLRTPRTNGAHWGEATREVARHWELQPFNWPKACWGGDLKDTLAQADATTRHELNLLWGDTTTVPDPAYQDVVELGLAEGWYQIRFGGIESLRPGEDGRPVCEIVATEPLCETSRLTVDFVLDATGLAAEPERNPLLADLEMCYPVERSASGGLAVAPDFSVPALSNGAGRVYVSGAMARGNAFGPVDSFLGLQFAALQSVDDLAERSGSGVARLDGVRSVGQWLRWATGATP